MTLPPPLAPCCSRLVRLCREDMRSMPGLTEDSMAEAEEVAAGGAEI